MTAPSDSHLTFGIWLKLRRRALQLTQEALAAKIGYTAATLQKLEQDARRPSKALAALLAGALDIPAAEREGFFQLAHGAAPMGRPDRPAAQDAGNEEQWRCPSPPVPSGQLIGRAVERASLVEELRRGQRRLITLVGPGGIGKTYLAIHVAAELAADGAGPAPFPNGVALVPLAAVHTAEAVPAAIAEALGLPLAGQWPASEQLAEALRGRGLLLVLDNCEQLLAPALADAFPALIARLLAGAPQLAILATSRERLRLRDEQVLVLGGLDLPDANMDGQAERSSAVQLFLERARLANPTMALGSDERQAIAQVCRRLEGMPLALELAAAWARALTPLEIAAELQRSLDFLTSDAHDIVARHRSIRAALDHSWRLLADAERAALARMAVFSGGFDREAAVAVAGANLPTLVALVDKSLVRAAPAAGVTRYTLHDLVRQYCGERLASEAGDSRGAEARHVAYFAGLLRHCLSEQGGETTPEVWARLAREGENLRAAWERAATAGDGATVLAMAPGLMTLYDYQGRLQEAVSIFGRAAEALASVGEAGTAARGLCLGVQGYFYFRVGCPQDAIRLLQQGAALTDAAGRSDLTARLLTHLGNVELGVSRPEDAARQFARAAERAAAAGDEGSRLWALFFQGSIAASRGDEAVAELFFATCDDAWRRQGYGRGVASVLLARSELARLRDDLPGAERASREALQICSLSHDAPALARCLRELGAIALARGDLAEARYLLAESCDSLRSLNDWWPYQRALYFLVILDVREGDLASAWRRCTELVARAKWGAVMRTVEAAYCVALILEAENRPAEALAVLLALGEAVSDEMTRRLIAALRAEVEGRLGPAAAAVVAGPGPVRLLLEELCARAGIGAHASRAPAAPTARAPRLESGLFIVETGETISPRELEVLRMLVAGASNQLIADTLIISLYTTKHHVASVLHKLGVTTRTQAALHGRALGIEPLFPGSPGRPSSGQ